jgi:3-oxoacyl-[acyl-carrier-protein] synthase-3
VPTTIESVATATGGRWRRRSAHGLADTAARRALDRAELSAGDVDLLINAGIYHDRNLGEPALAALIQEDIGANPEDPHPGGHGTFSFDVANGSAGMLTGLRIADGFLRAGTIRHALVGASDARPAPRLAPDFPFGATGAAVVCGWRTGGHGIHGFRFASPPQDNGLGDTGGLRATVEFVGGGNRLTVAEQSGFAAAAGAWAGEVAGKLLADHGLQAGDVDLVVANPLTPAFLDALAAQLGVDRGRVAEPPDGRLAHTAGLGMALAPVITAGRLEGRTALLVSAGAGPVAGAALVR